MSHLRVVGGRGATAGQRQPRATASRRAGATSSPAPRSKGGARVIPLRPAQARKRRQSFLRQVASAWFVGKLLAVVVLGASAWALSEAATARPFRVAGIHVAGHSLLATEEVLDRLPAAGTSIFALRTRSLERALRADPIIERAEVRTRLPNLVHVRIWERTPVAVWDTGGRQVVADVDGLVLREGLALPLPIIHAAEAPAPEPGERVDAAAVQMAQALAPRLDALRLRDARLEYRPGRGMSIAAPGSPRVALGFAGDLDAKLAAYLSIRAHLERTGERAELIDVRFLERPYYR